MTARVLVVDDILANVRLLEAKLTAEYFEVITAMNGLDALEAIARNKPDLILLDVMMPGLDGIEVCKRIKANPATQHIPVVMVTALDQPEDRVSGLNAGADDFLTKPVNDISLFCRIKSLVRLKMLTDELRIRAETGDSIHALVRPQAQISTANGRVLLVDTRETSVERIKFALASQHEVTAVVDPNTAVEIAASAALPYELIVVSLEQERFDGLRLCSQLRSFETTRQTPILILVEPDDQTRLLRALDMGVNDYLLRPVDRQELLARVNTQVKRWRYTEQLRHSVKASIELAVTDHLTGLYNRRYLETHLTSLIDHFVNRGKSLAVLALDVDFFKPINDTYGHDAGDKVLQELASRIRENTRTIDLCCRTGGEEFVLVLPSTNMAAAHLIAERLRKAIAFKTFTAGPATGIPVTISIGLATLDNASDTMDTLLKRADSALYAAKREGRNRVVQAAA
ncbi:MAG: PleD family two-component system response regulator [Alphaproteobacteria bacterium]|nr:PleD family two-component system response regulator [Alphaproteobacteria bacterium]